MVFILGNSVRTLFFFFLVSSVEAGDTKNTVKLLYKP